MWCSTCGRELHQIVAHPDATWLDPEARLFCDVRERTGGAGWRHLPVETEEEVLLEALADGPGLKDRATVDERLKDLQREWHA